MKLQFSQKTLNLKKLVADFFIYVEKENIETYNEFSFQHELGIFLREELVDYKVQWKVLQKLDTLSLS